MPDVVVRDAVAADADAIARIHRDGWRTGYAGLLPQWYLDSLTAESARERWRAQLAGQDRVTHERVAEVDGRVVGFCTSGPCFDPDSPRGDRWGEIWDFFVADRARGQGFGRPLLATCLADMAAAGRREAVVWVLAGNERALRAYARAGFRDDGLTRSEQRQGFVMRDARLRVALDVAGVMGTRD